MLTDGQLADRLRTQLRIEVAAVEPSGDLLARLRRRQARRSRRLQVSIVGVPATAGAVAIGVLIATSGASGGAEPKKSVVLTAATVHKMASASRLALKHSGRAVITYRERSNGALQDTGRYGITFAGKNWNAVISQTFPATKGQPAHTQTAINRIVNGQFFLYTEGRDGRVEWLHETNPHGHPSMTIPDPRTMFRLLNPSAKFKVVGHRVTGGLRLTELRATRAPRLPALGGLPGVDRGAHVASLVVWIDRHNVVHQMSMRVTQHHTSDPLYFKKLTNGGIEVLVPSKAYLKEARATARKLRKHYQPVTVRVDPSLTGTVRHYFYVTSASVTFSDYGKRQVITAPRHSVPVFSRG
jgi:hypothetical protein